LAFYEVVYYVKKTVCRKNTRKPAFLLALTPSYPNLEVPEGNINAVRKCNILDLLNGLRNYEMFTE
jgi:hypothetical protein